ncbi:uncharacterized protein [Primulina huaijiensis]|uniref:uncharacterized protein n=1 Tax=Primulina huaijiensis TaxID=1492673 RepID=UPI003CC76AF5
MVMAGREVREYTNLTDPKDTRLEKGKDRIDDEEITFQRIVSKVQNLIEGCIQRSMNKSECKHALQFHHKIHPDITEIIWRRLEKENEEFFQAYYGRLVLIKQIRKFNMFLAKQASWWMYVRRLSTKHTSDPSLALNRQQASPSAPPLKAEDMQQLHVCHNLGSSIQSSPKGFVNTPFCDRQNIKMHSVRFDDVPSTAPQNIVPLGTVNMQQRPEFGPSILSSPTLRTGYVSYPAAPQYPISFGAGPSNPGYFQENVYMSGYDLNFGSSQNLVDPGNRDAMMTKTESVITGEAGYDGDLDHAPYGYFVDLSPLTGDDASITALSSDCASITSTPTKLNNLYLEGNAFSFHISYIWDKYPTIMV